MRPETLEEKKRRWDRRQESGERAWLVVSAVSAAVLGLAITLLS